MEIFKLKFNYKFLCLQAFLNQSTLFVDSVDLTVATFSNNDKYKRILVQNNEEIRRVFNLKIMLLEILPFVEFVPGVLSEFPVQQKIVDFCNKNCCCSIFIFEVIEPSIKFRYAPNN
ncbi:MAG: hypothetical protein H0V01_10445 [Bacteroidetes bacterium]|nr:hypothetical protein [Bacteroidota bacterium]HET6245077.1 hypothetical protein [Bacteroidia bacterium]